MEPLEAVSIVGVGLIGGSIGLALRDRRLARRVIGVGRNRERLEHAQALGAIDRYTTDFEEAMPGSSVVVVCTPVNQIAADVVRCARHASPETLMTDAGSTKRSILDQIGTEPSLLTRFVGAHPIAGSEKSGVQAARANLFEESVCVLTPVPATPPALVDRAEAFWEALGCQVARMTPDVHDEVLAQMSHLPHVLAAALARAAPAASLPFGGGAFRDMTRVAAADPGLWVSILLENRSAVLQSLDRYSDSLKDLRELLHRADSESLMRWWRVANEQRRRYEETPKHGHGPSAFATGEPSYG